MKLKIIIPVFVSFIFFNVSCKKKSDLELNFLDKEKKWVYINEEKLNSHSMSPNFYIEFTKDDTCQNLSIINDTPMISIHGGDSGHWEYLEKDSSLTVFEHKFKVLEIHKDTISVLRKSDNWKAIFINDIIRINNERRGNR